MYVLIGFGGIFGLIGLGVSIAFVLKTIEEYIAFVLKTIEEYELLKFTVESYGKRFDNIRDDYWKLYHRIEKLERNQVPPTNPCAEILLKD
jgi:hypothetical protein